MLTPASHRHVLDFGATQVSTDGAVMSALYKANGPESISWQWPTRRVDDGIFNTKCPWEVKAVTSLQASGSLILNCPNALRVVTQQFCS